jgi:hypothetical protein
VRKRLSREKVTPDLATPLALYSVEDHGHHLQKEKAVTAKTFTLRHVTNPVNVPKSEEDASPLT